MWSVDPLKGYWSQARNTSQPFVLSTGDPTGYSSHGDFLVGQLAPCMTHHADTIRQNGWDNKVLQQAIDTCTDDSGVIEKCGIFKLNNGTAGDAACQAVCLRSPATVECPF